MNPEKFSLNEILRYFICGSAGIASTLYSAKVSFSTLLGADSATILAILSLGSFVAGSIIYSIYRAIVYVYIGRITLVVTRFCLGFWHWLWWILPTTIPDLEFKGDQWRWKERAKGGEGNPRLDEWASQVHLLYSSTLAIVAGWLFTSFLLAPAERISFWPILGKLCVILGPAAFVLDLRRRHAEERLMETGAVSEFSDRVAALERDSTERESRTKLPESQLAELRADAIRDQETVIVRSVADADLAFKSVPPESSKPQDPPTTSIGRSSDKPTNSEAL